LIQKPGYVTATATGRIILSQHQFYQPQYLVIELKSFPNRDLNDRINGSELKRDSGQRHA
jgi:hypothetical protein